VKTLLEQADSLKLNLTRDQRTKLNTIESVYNRQIDSVGNMVAQILVEAGPRPDLGALGPKLQKVNLGVITVLQQSVKDAQNALSAEQWAKVPERIRLPLSAAAQAQQQRPPR